MHSTYITDPTAFFHVWSGTFCGIGLALVLYGIYINLFILAIYTLSRRKTAGKNVLLVACCTMFILGTTQNILWLYQTSIAIRISQELVYSATNFGEASISTNLTDAFVTLDLAEDIVFAINKLLYRCYKIWGSQKRAVVFPAILVLSGAVISFVSVASLVISPSGKFDNLRITFGISAATNLLLMGLTGNSIGIFIIVFGLRNEQAGRIWWIRREAFHVDVDNNFRNRYKMPIILMYGLVEMHAVRE
ncbi:hypothetical protein GGX14DRAFT_586876 [Mycena pura]|uniref:Uncharacterized protein n=1 Tax=Mycena pura TaxID=153505 RepID=A0AAD6V0D5_9AGAR|nr:hypothetical protein GGX14DRAFT_586876 [Mycena pura]